MESLQPCPSCLSDVEVVRVRHNNYVEQQYYFFIQCQHCGKGTSKAYASQCISAAIWNAIAQEGYHHFER